MSETGQENVQGSQDVCAEVRCHDQAAGPGRKMGVQEATFYDLYMTHDGDSLLPYAVIVETPLKPLDGDTVQRALDQLQRESAMLRTRVERRSDGPYVVPMEQPRVNFQVLPPGQDWLEIYHHLVNVDYRIDPHSGPMWSVKLMNDPANVLGPQGDCPRSAIFLKFLHIIADGLAITEAIGRLVELLDALLGGDGKPEEVETKLHWPPPPLQKIPPSIESLLAEQIRELKIPEGHQGDLEPTFEFNRRYVKPYRPELADQYKNAIAPRLAGAECISQLRKRCHDRGVTLNSAFTAAATMSASQMMPQVPPNAKNFFIATVVNGRRYVAPPMDRACITRSLIHMHSVLVPASDTSQFWDLADEIDADMKRQLKLKIPMVLEFLRHSMVYKEPETKDLAAQQVSKENADPPQARIVFALNNLGSLDDAIPQTASVRPVQLFRSYRCDPKRFQVFCAVCCQTVNGQLCVNVNHIPGRVEVADIWEFTDRMMDIIENVALS